MAFYSLPRAFQLAFDHTLPLDSAQQSPVSVCVAPARTSLYPRYRLFPVANPTLFMDTVSDACGGERGIRLNRLPTFQACVGGCGTATAIGLGGVPQAPLCEPHGPKEVYYYGCLG